MRSKFTIFLLLVSLMTTGQTLGGNAAYNFLKLPAVPNLTAMGGINTSYKTNEVSLTSNNPALLQPSLHGQVNLAFNSFMAGIKTYSFTGAYHIENSNATVGGQIYFLDYGLIPQTDAAGNEMGNFRPVDFLVQVSAARPYLDRWNFGTTIKFIQSSYHTYRSSALALDVGIHYSDSAHGFSAGLLARNMGLQLKTYAGEAEDLPFDLQVGLTKRLEKAPFGFSFTARHLHGFNIHYNDTLFNNENDLSSSNNFFTKLLNHFVVATHIYLGANLEASLGYNHLRRSELNAGLTGNGLNGFSMGLQLKFNKLEVQYARSNYQRNIAYNQLGISLRLNRIFNPGSGL